jgi:CDP-4-dehydro-6-deoxyglucose reductase
LQWYGVLAAGELPRRSIACQLLACSELGGDVWCVRLLAPAGKPPRYHAGQYLLLEDASGEQMAFSIASAPHRGRELELHILAAEERPKALIEQIQRERLVRVQLPFGDTHLAQLPDGPLLLLAAGTGMAQMQSLVEHCRALGFAHPIHLYWGARQAEDFYALPYLTEWQQIDNLRLHQVVSDADDWAGRSGLLHEAVREDFNDLKDLHVYASGSPAMIYATLDALVEAGMDATQMRADVFAYAPRK